MEARLAEHLRRLGQADGNWAPGGRDPSPNHLLCHPGRWSGARSYAYSWILDGSLRRSTKRRPYAPFGTVRGHRVSCKVTAFSPSGSASATSPTIRVR